MTFIVIKHLQYLVLEAKPPKMWILPDAVPNFLCDFRKLFNLDAQPHGEPGWRGEKGMLFPKSEWVL